MQLEDNLKIEEAEKVFSNILNNNTEEIENIKDIGFSKVVAGSDAEKYVLNSLDREYANQIKTSAYGQIKNFCQYRAHCVEVEREREYPQEFSISALFLDSSCI